MKESNNLEERMSSRINRRQMEPGKSWIQTTFYKRECVKFLPVSWVDHRCSPVCHVCQNLIRCCCGRLIGEHVELDSMSRGRGPAPPMSSPPSGDREDWSVTKHTKASSTDAFGSIDFQGSTKRTCRAKYVRLSCDAKPEQLLCLMLREWNLAPPKLVISIHGGLENFPLPQRVGQAFSKGLIRAAETTGAWILTDGFNTGVSMYVGDAVKLYGTHERRKRNVIGVTPWGLVENHRDLIGQDVLRHYHTLGNPLSKRSSLNCLHSHFLLVDDGTLGKSGGQLELRRRLERHLHRQRIHPRLGQRVPVVCVVVEGGPPVLSLVLEYVSRTPPVPVIVFEGTGRAADLLALIHKQTAVDRKLDTDIKEDFLLRVQAVFGVGRPEASQLFTVLTSCMGHREMITIFDSESEDHLEPDVAILTASLRGTPADQLSITLAWDRADIAQEHILVYGQQWKVGALEQAMLNALLMDRVGFVKLLIENGITLKHFLTVSRLEELYNTQQGSPDNFLYHIIEEAKKCRLSVGHKISLIDIGMAIEYLIGGAYRSTYMRKSFRAVYNQIHSALKEASQEGSGMVGKPRKRGVDPATAPQTQPPFFRTAEPYRRKQENPSLPHELELASPAELGGTSLFVYSINDLFVWAVLMRRQQMALFLWQHGEQAMARAVVACRLYRAMATEAKERIMGDSIAEELKKFSIEFGQLAVDLLDKAFKENECMAMKLLTSEMTDWSNFTCLQMAVASGLRPFVAHSCTQMLLTDLWMGHLNMRKNSWVKIIVSILLPMAIQLLEFKSKAEMSHIPQTHEALQFGVEAASSGAPPTETAEQCDAESGRNCAQSRSGLAVRCLPWARKVYDFYNAPVVKFWFHTMSYLAFLMLFSYTVLVRMESRPSAAEWLVIAYIISTAVEKTRELWVSEPRKFRKKLKVWFSEYWNISDFIAIFLFFTGLVLRCQSDPARTAGRLMYCLDIIFWFVRLMDILAINQQAGPYLTMITKMMSNMFYIMIIMGIVLVSFGTPRWSILKPDEEPSWDLLKQVLFQPYFMMFGEVYAGEINPCEADPDCPPGSFLNPLLQAVYLFMQYIIMVNLLIAFYNNVYVHMKTISNKLWKYNRYRYIMTYQEKPWLPPPLILLSHMTLCVSALWHRKRGAAGQERDSGLKLFLAPEDLKKLHEFEEKCVAAYFRDKNESQNSSQLNRIRSASDKAEEMVTTLSEVAEKVQFIQESLQTLDGHLGRLQDLSALAVDTLNLLSATDNRQHEAVLLGNSQPIRRPYQQLSHSWSLRIGGNVMPNQAPLSPKAYRSTPPSLLRGLGLGKKHPSLEWPPGGGAGLWDSQPKWVLGNLDGDDSVFRCRLNGDSYEGSPAGNRLLHGSFSHLWGVPWRDRMSCDSSGPSCPSSPTGLWAPESHLRPSQEESMEEEDDDEERSVSRASSHVFLLPDPQSETGRRMGILNPAFCGDGELAKRRPFRKWPYAGPEQQLEHSRSLSASVETLAMPRARTPRHSTTGEDTVPPPGQEEKELSRTLERKRSFGRKCVKIQEGKAKNVRRFEKCTHTVESSRKNRAKGKGLAGRKFRSSVSLTQLNFDQVDFSQKSLGPNTRRLSQSAWSSWSQSVSGRSSVQSWVTGEARGALLKSTEDLDPHYSAMERNNLMRLAHTIPFTPVSLLGGDEVCVYTLEESDSESTLIGTSSWCQRGQTAVLQPITHQGALDGGLRRALRVVCTWAEGDVLKPGCVYVVKAFRTEVVRTWQREFPNSTSLHLCLREIQQQRAAQKLMQVFNQVKPITVPHSLRFLDVSLLYWPAEGEWLTIERNMSGDFMKYSNNTGEEIAPSCGLEETVLAFSHWTYEYTCRELLVLDLQGVGMELTDPSVIRVDDKSSSEDLVFGPANLGNDAIHHFILKHTCNSCCGKLGLSDLRKCSGLQKSNSDSDEDVSMV
ncbi:transient receptor potential cation channel subfamily M member 6 isoform X3 [Electrophorus electricus]|uniref:transient receptor potential cation channel subfamily M member 6 isoform X3 n=1 Tax=Electrophorus electricus TaxID=8005 RepID=UPI0015CFE3F5|nr:transient receptor potential cation channel subfamily M member 6 isoform X3 [Electrophorus electricus]